MAQAARDNVYIQGHEVFADVNDFVIYGGSRYFRVHTQIAVAEVCTIVRQWWLLLLSVRILLFIVLNLQPTVMTACTFFAKPSRSCL